MKLKIFISKSRNELPLLELFSNEKDCSLLGESLIRFEALTFDIVGTPDIVCFTSPRSVWFYFQNPLDSNTILFACVGQATANKLTELGYSASFIGSNPGDPHGTSEEFAFWVGNRTVLFPESERSLGSLAKGLSQKQVMRLPVYKTASHPQIIPPQDVYVFTSPSNVESFLQLNEPPRNKTIVAWGKSTADFLREKNIEVSNTLLSASETELIAYLESNVI